MILDIEHLWEDFMSHTIRRVSQAHADSGHRYQKADVRKQGFHSEVRCITVPSSGERKAVKHIGLHAKGFPIAQAIALAEEIRIYQNKLQAIRIPMPALEEIRIGYNLGGDTACIIVSTPWAGDDIPVCLSRSYPHRHKIRTGWLAREICRVLLLACRYRNEYGYMHVGIDAKAANFTLAWSPTGKPMLWYVDQFPPRYWHGESPLIDAHPIQTPVAMELGLFKYFDWRGVLLTFISQFSRLKPQFRKHIEAIALQYFGASIGDDGYTKFQMEYARLPWIRLRAALRDGSTKQAETILYESVWEKVCGVRYGPYTLREIVLEFCLHGLIASDTMETMYRDLHWEDGELPYDVWHEIQKDLCRSLHGGYIRPRLVS